MNKNINRSTLKKYPDVMSLSQMAECLGISTKLASRILRECEIYSVKMGREYRISKSAIMEYVSGKRRHTAQKNCVESVTSNPQGWTCQEKCGIVCANQEKEVC